MPFITEGTMSSTTDLWGTPQNLFDKLNERFNFEVDVCADENNHKCPVYFTKEQDGLKQDWTKYRSIFMNPPYGRHMGDWMSKMYAASQCPDVGVCVCVIPCRTDTRWWEYVMRASEVWLVKGRLHYNDGEVGAPFPSCVVIYDQREKHGSLIFHWIEPDLTVIV